MIPGFTGIYRTDDTARAVYAEAAGIARVTPKAVAVPATVDDVVTLVRWASEHGMPLIPRGSGSSMSGGAVGDGVIVDLSRFNEIGDIDTENQRVWVGPGAIRNAIDAKARQTGLMFPPDPSSGPFCTIGGMISTNAAGAHTLRYGPTRAWISAIECVFEDGSRAILRRGETVPTGIPALDRLSAVEDAIRATATVATHSGVRKDVSGYAIAEFARSNDVIDLLIGSEGTLAIIIGAELMLAPVQPAIGAVLGVFPSLDDAVAGATLARENGASACELLDRTFIEIAKERFDIPAFAENADALLLVDVEADDTAGAAQIVQSIASAFTKAGASEVRQAMTASESEALWALRHAASPALAALAPEFASLQFIEDGAVPPQHLAAYVRGVRQILVDRGVRGAIFGHAGDAHVHVNPLIQTNRLGWRGDISHILQDVVKLTLSLNGTLTGEHGDGRLRTPLLAKVWPAEALRGFRQVKEAFDPAGIFNPGVKIPLPGQRPITDIKYDSALPALPDAAAAALTRLAAERCYSQFRLDLVEAQT